MSVWKRVRQVWAACTAHLTPQDRTFVAAYLTKKEIRLFDRMDLAHQYHALRVARTALRLMQKERICCDGRLLARCALLHDTAKRAGEIGTLDKIICVLFDHALPRQMRAFARRGRGGAVQNKRHAAYLYYRHAQLAAKELRAMGLAREASVVAGHHEKPHAGEPLELTVLRRADEMN